MIEEEKLYLCSWFHLWIFTGFTHKLSQTFVIYKDHTSSLRKPAKNVTSGPTGEGTRENYSSPLFWQVSLLPKWIIILWGLHLFAVSGFHSVSRALHLVIDYGCWCFSLHVCQNGIGNKKSFFFGVCVSQSARKWCEMWTCWWRTGGFYLRLHLLLTVTQSAWFLLGKANSG